MEDELFITRHQGRQLQEIRQRIAPFWEDEAAREINLRYLNPHADENDAMLEGCARQLAVLRATNTELEMAEKSALAVELLASDITEQLDLCEQDLALCFQYFEHYAQATSVTSALFVRIDELISNAFIVCEGVPKS